ncbi:MAG: hypothetical protein AAGL90_03145 [Pseudomonadota bacterium]
MLLSADEKKALELLVEALEATRDSLKATNFIDCSKLRDQYILICDDTAKEAAAELKTSRNTYLESLLQTGFELQEVITNRGFDADDTFAETLALAIDDLSKVRANWLMSAVHVSQPAKWVADHDQRATGIQSDRCHSADRTETERPNVDRTSSS